MLDVQLHEARGRQILAALSGGADSVALLILLCRARDAGMLRVSAAHFDHMIRGAESQADVNFCQSLCERYGVPFALGRADVPEIARRTGEGFESCARNLRHRFLQETASVMGANLIALGHHADDQAETVLMHLLRGAGPAGIVGMRRLSGNLYRPLIECRKADIVSFLEEIGETWREDSTNRLADNPRNALRLSALPALEKVYPGAAFAIARYAKAAAVEDDFVARAADAFMQKRVEHLPNGHRIDLSGEPEEALLRRALRRLCGPDLNTDKLRELLCLETATDIGNGMRAQRHGAYLYVLRPYETPDARMIDLAGVTCLHGICRLTSTDAAPMPERMSKTTQVLDREALVGAVLRTRCTGDRIAPLGLGGSKSLSDYMTDAKIDPPLRDVTPVVARGNEILWVIGHGISRTCALQSKDRAAVRLTCETVSWGGIASCETT